MGTHSVGSPASFYAPVDDTQRDPLLRAYVARLEERDGRLDPRTGRLPNREASLQAMDTAPVYARAGLPQAEFDRLYHAFDPAQARRHPELLLMLLFSKMNAGEAYGVRVVKAVHGRRWKQGSDPASHAIQYAQEEEEYHTRILVGASHHFQVKVSPVYNPPPALRLLIGALAYAPRPFFHPVLFGAEVAGVYVFNYTLNHVRDFVPDQPELADVLEQRLIEVLIDEVGHVAFNRLVLNERGRALGRALARQTIRGMPMITPELRPVGFDDRVERGFTDFDLRDLPRAVLDRAFFA